MLEYFHRLAAAGVSVLLLVAIGLVARKREWRQAVGSWLGISLVLLVVQIVLGMLTVTKLLRWEVVATHLGVAMIFLASLVVMARKAQDLAAQGSASRATVVETPTLAKVRTLSILAGIIVYSQVLLGGSVSSNYAGLACPDFPTCHGDWFPGFSGLVGLQFSHRLGAFVATAALLALLWFWRGILAKEASWNRPKTAFFSWAPWSIGLLLLVQWSLGVGMVFFGVRHEMTIPILFSVAHLAVGALLFVLVISAIYEFHRRLVP